MKSQVALVAMVLAVSGQVFSTSVPAASAQRGLTIEHQPGCILSSMYAVLRAKVIPGSAVAQARIYFRASEQAFWTWVPMARDTANADTWKATLPKPLPDTKQVHYYVQVVGTDTTDNRTQRFAVRVDPLGRGCTASPGTYAESASVGVGSDEADLKIAGLIGFDGRGIRDLTPKAASEASQRSGSSAAKILIVGGVLAVGGGVALAAGGGKETPVASATTPTTTTLPSLQIEVEMLNRTPDREISGCQKGNTCPLSMTLRVRSNRPISSVQVEAVLLTPEDIECVRGLRTSPRDLQADLPLEVTAEAFTSLCEVPFMTNKVRISILAGEMTLSQDKLILVSYNFVP